MKRVAMCAGIVVLTLLVTAGALEAAPIFWTDWAPGDNCQGQCFEASGTITTPTATVGVTYNNPQGIGFYNTGAPGEIDYWTPRTPVGNSPYTSTAVDNVPTGTDLIALQFAGNQMLTFSETIANPVFGFVSLNVNGYAFLNQDFNILSLGGEGGNNCGYWGCGGASKNIVVLPGGDIEYQLIANNVGGTEPHGTIQFLGAFDSLVWRSLTNEYWNGFQVGVQGTDDEVFAVPEPTSMMLLGSGLTTLYLRRRRKSKR